MIVKDFYHKQTNTLTYIVHSEESKNAVIIDPVLDYEPYSSRISQETVESYLRYIDENNLKLRYILETHAHADHLTSAQVLKQKFPEAKTAIHENISLVQQTFKPVFNFGDDFDEQGKVFDQLLKDQQRLDLDDLTIEVIHTPGHTPACVSFLVNNKALFTGDALFMPDFGTGRCDFPKGSAESLYHSIANKLYHFPGETLVYVGHDYQPGGRPLAFQTTIEESKEQNIHLKANTSEDEFVKFRQARDSGLMAPKLLLPSIQVNIQNGIFPEPESNGTRYLKLPIKQ